MPKLSDTMVEGTIARWKKKQGDTIETGDILAEVETDKATMEMEAFDDGVLKEIYVNDGGVAKVGEKIALILAEGESPDGADAAPAAKGGGGSDCTARGEQSRSAIRSARTGRPERSACKGFAAREENRGRARSRSRRRSRVPAQAGALLPRTFPRRARLRAAAPAPAAPAAAPKIQATAGEGDKRIPLTGMRRVIAQRLLESKTQLPISIFRSKLMRAR